MAENKLNAVLTQKIMVSPTLAIMRFVPEGWDLPDFKPGQYGVLGLPYSAKRIPTADKLPMKDPGKIIKRAYSVASSSVVKEYVEFYIALVESGELTPRLFALEPGDKVWLSSKFTGMFTLAEVPDRKNILFIATGTGLAPYMSMIRTNLECNSERKFAVIHGARHSWDLGYRSELNGFKRLCSNFEYIPIIDHPEEESGRWAGETGFVNKLWTEGRLTDSWGVKPTPENTRIFLCGNPLMIKSMLEILQSEGFTEFNRREKTGQIHVEKYWA
jgi:ferredoxin--NADP+ reductase